MSQLQAAIKRQLEDSFASSSQPATSTPSGNSNKRNKIDLNLDESIIGAVNDINVNDSIDNALTSVSQNEQIGIKNKKIAEAVLKQLKPVLVDAINKSLDQFFTDLLAQLNDKINIIANSIQKQGLLAHYERDKIEQYSRKENFRVVGLNISGDDDNDMIMDKVCQLANSIDVELHKEDFVACHRVGKPKC